MESHTELSDLQVHECARSDAEPFIEKWHYSHGCKGVTSSLCFRVDVDDRLVGAAVFGLPAGMGVYKKYSEDGRYKLLELRRFVMIDDLPPNNESYVLSRMLKTCREEGIERVLSYADPAHGHQGIIYQATGFTRLGTTSKRKHIMWNGKKYPDRNVHQTNFPYHKELRAALESGEAERFVVPGKVIYLKDLIKPWELKRREKVDAVRAGVSEENTLASSEESRSQQADPALTASA